MLNKILQRFLGGGCVLELRFGAEWKYRAVNIVMLHPVVHLATPKSQNAQNLLEGECLILESQRNSKFVSRHEIGEAFLHTSREGV